MGLGQSTQHVWLGAVTDAFLLLLLLTGQSPENPLTPLGQRQVWQSSGQSSGTQHTTCHCCCTILCSQSIFLATRLTLLRPLRSAYPQPLPSPCVLPSGSGPRQALQPSVWLAQGQRWGSTGHRDASVQQYSRQGVGDGPPCGAAAAGEYSTWLCWKWHTLCLSREMHILAV